jgi:hypothetical protein
LSGKDCNGKTAIRSALAEDVDPEEAQRMEMEAQRMEMIEEQLRPR